MHRTASKARPSRSARRFSALVMPDLSATDNPLINLEVWGAPISRPQRDPGNSNFVYQRFQRGVMHFDAATGRTQGLLLADYLKAILRGRDLPSDLAQAAHGSKYFNQYCPTPPAGCAAGRPGRDGSDVRLRTRVEVRTGRWPVSLASPLQSLSEWRSRTDMRQGETPDENQLASRSAYLAELQCFLCGSLAGAIEIDRKPLPAHGVWHPSGGGPLQRVADWRQLRCNRCGGALFVESVEAVVYQDESEQLRREAPRRGRPPKWLVEERRRQSEAAELRLWPRPGSARISALASPGHSTPQQVQRTVRVGRADRRGQARVAGAQRRVHAPRDAAIREVALRLGALLDDVGRLGPVHLEQAARAIRQRQQIVGGQRRRLRDGAGRLFGLEQRLRVQCRPGRPRARRARPAAPRPAGKDVFGRLEPVRPGQRLLDLDAAPMPMQVAERAQVDQDVEGQRVAAAVLAQQVVVRAAAGDRQVEDLAGPGPRSSESTSAWIWR